MDTMYFVSTYWVDRGYQDCAHVAAYYKYWNYPMDAIYGINCRRRAEMYWDWCLWDRPLNYNSGLQRRVVYHAREAPPLL